MLINADFSKRVAVHAADIPWVPTPMHGVERRMLDRIGAEVARATTIVRYAPGSAFSAHTHAGGEEFLVLDGLFQDEQGDYPAGTYVRNPPKSSHTPASAPGCTIFVKLQQFDPADRSDVRIDTNQSVAFAVAGRDGVLMIPLFSARREKVRIEIWEPNADIRLEAVGGFEVLVLEGSFQEGRETFKPQSWLRLPSGVPLVAKAGSSGTKLWIKTGHLDHADRS